MWEKESLGEGLDLHITVANNIHNLQLNCFPPSSLSGFGKMGIEGMTNTGRVYRGLGKGSVLIC
jgi:hypothetical protein